MESEESNLSNLKLTSVPQFETDDILNYSF